MEVPVSASRAPRTGVRRGMMVCAVIAVALLCAAATALAGVDHWFSGTLLQESGYASTSSNPITYIEATGNHNGFCIAKDSSSGFGTASKLTSGPRTCASSGGFANRNENGTGSYHAWVDNQTSNDIVFDTSTHYSW